MTTKLSKKKAIELTGELWTHIKETDDVDKSKWPKWDEVREKYGQMSMLCPLCKYAESHGDNVGFSGDCLHCPYYKKFGNCCKTYSPYWQWKKADTAKLRLKYATEILSQIRQLK